MAELIGLPAFLKLVEWRGGTWIHVPKTPKPGQQLVGVIGLEAAQALAKDFIEQVGIPKCDAVARTALHAAIAERRANGEPELTVALDVGFTGRWVRVIYARHCVDDGQGELDV